MRFDVSQEIEAKVEKAEKEWRFVYVPSWWQALPFAAAWMFAFRNLAIHWTTNPVYSYGWLVPVFASLAFVARWKWRPPKESAPGWAAPVLVSAAALFLPTWIFAQPNPDWSLVAWMLTGEAAVMSLCAIAMMGGAAWFRHFCFPIFLISTAVPCPRTLEQPVTIGLMRGVASCTVELLNFLNVAAVQHGNVIEIRAGLLGVDEACSGVRGLQASATAALFLGEMFLFSAGRRFALLLVGISAALLTNICRTFFLSWTADRSGLASLERWHDPAGFVTLGVCCVAVWMAAEMMSKGHSQTAPASGTSACPRALPFGLIASLAVWLGAVAGFGELWFGFGDRVSRSAWALVPPKQSASIPLHEGVLRQLQCDRASTAVWQEPGGVEWSMYCFDWAPGPLRSRVLANIHRPDICLSSVGFKLLQDRGTVCVSASGFDLAFHAYTFEREGRNVFVYYGIWQQRSSHQKESQVLSTSEHVAGLQAVLWRERRLGQRVAEFAVTGCATADQANGGLKKVVADLLVPSPPE